ncbi:MAG: Hsp20/alpha crystallin family protein [Desulfobulbus sp.]|nr:Hsp20/alpha crystallin family protein [Desulfobulbus sp.]
MSENSELTTSKDQFPSPEKQLPVIAPEVDIFENEHEILLHANMPGVGKEDVDIHIDNGKLTLSGTRRMVTIGSSIWREFGEVEYRRNFSVPQSIDTNEVSAEIKDGLLCLHLPKSDAAKPRQIEIKAA